MTWSISSRFLTAFALTATALSITAAHAQSASPTIYAPWLQHQMNADGSLVDEGPLAPTTRQVLAALQARVGRTEGACGADPRQWIPSYQPCDSYVWQHLDEQEAQAFFGATPYLAQVVFPKGEGPRRCVILSRVNEFTAHWIPARGGGSLHQHELKHTQGFTHPVKPCEGADRTTAGQ